MDQELGLGMLGAGALDVVGADPGVDVALAVPDVEAGAALGVVAQPGLALDEGAEPHVGAEEDLGRRRRARRQMCSTTLTALDEVQQ